jgi:DNA-binding NarL/FixJ family response regulator
LFIDDEKVDLVDDLKQEGFSVDQDFEGNSIGNIERGYIDLLVLDYKGIGLKYGQDEGLSLLRAIKRVNPAVYVLAYTSQNLPPSKSSDFYTLCDGTLNKDAGVADSIQRIEEALRSAVAPERLWNGILKSAAIEPGTDRAEKLEKQVVAALMNSKKEQAKAYLGDDLTDASGSLISALLEKLMSLAIDKALTGL